MAVQAYLKGCTCSQAVISAFTDELNLTKEQAYRLVEGFGSGFGGEQEVCGAFAAATMIISYLHSDGNDTGNTKHDTYTYIKKAALEYKQIYGSIRCIDIMEGKKPVPFGCPKKVNDAVNLVKSYMASINKKEI